MEIKVNNDTMILCDWEYLFTSLGIGQDVGLKRIIYGYEFKKKPFKCIYWMLLFKICYILRIWKKCNWCGKDFGEVKMNYAAYLCNKTMYPVHEHCLEHIFEKQKNSWENLGWKTESDL